MADTKIEWADKVWNPVVGCEKVSQGCKHCYAKTIHDKRHNAFLLGKKMPRQYAVPFESVQMLPDRLNDPLRWRKPQMIFVNSVSDLFHKDISDSFIDDVFLRMSLADQHKYLILTKRVEQMLAYTEKRNKTLIELGYPDGFAGHYKNVWLGVSVEDQPTADERLSFLRNIPTIVPWVSYEPALAGINLSPHLDFLKWVVCGGESGTDARPMNLEWARSLRDQCKSADVPFFMKQLSGDKSRAIKDVNLFPPDLQIREYPHTKKLEAL